MQVVIVGGHSLVGHLIDLIKREADTIVIINEDIEFCEYLSNHYPVDVICGNGVKQYVLDEAEIEGFDFCIALTERDADNLAICQICQHFYGIENHACVVSSAGNADTFRRLGIGTVIDNASLVAQAIDGAVFGTAQASLYTSKAPAHLKVGERLESMIAPSFVEKRSKPLWRTRMTD